MDTFDAQLQSRSLSIRLSIEVLRNLEYLLTSSKPLTDDQITYCLMLHDEIARLMSLIFPEVPGH